jgi:hypothetical protein
MSERIETEVGGEHSPTASGMRCHPFEMTPASLLTRPVPRKSPAHRPRGGSDGPLGLGSRRPDLALLVERASSASTRSGPREMRRDVSDDRRALR